MGNRSTNWPDRVGARFGGPRLRIEPSPPQLLCAEVRHSGRLLLEWSGNGTGPGEFIGPSSAGPDALVVDVVGNVYATDPGNYRAQKFDPSGNFLGAFGSIGQGQGQFITGPYGLAVDAAGNIYASDLTGTVQKFDGSSGRFLAKWENTGATRLIAVDNNSNILIRDDTTRSIVRYRQP